MMVNPYATVDPYGNQMVNPYASGMMPNTYNPGYNPNMPWGRRGSGYFDDRRGPYGYGGYRGGPRGRDYYDDDYYGDRRRGRSWDRADWRDRDYGRRRPTYWDRDGDGIDDRYQSGRGYRRPTYYDRDGDGIDDRLQYNRPREVIRRTRYVDDYDRGTRYYNDAPVTRTTTYRDPVYYDGGDKVVTRTTRPVTGGDTVVKKTTTTRTVSD